MSGAFQGGTALEALPAGMGFGPVWQGDGVVFRFWAPGVDGAELVIPAQGLSQVMEDRGNGWFATHVSDVPVHGEYGFRLPDGMIVPDPASRLQLHGVHELSAVTNPNSYQWTHRDWSGRPWHEAVISELHVGAFTPEGSFDGVRTRLRHLAHTGITAIELMPLAAFSGQRNWGYDGVLPFAPCASYGLPDDLKRLIDEAHGLGMMVFLDVVYNHFGPDGNYLHLYADAFFDAGRDTPWGPAIDFSRRPVREFFIQNALYWLEEFRFDGLRLDAVHAIHDHSAEHFLWELCRRVDDRFQGRRHVHLVLENADNEAHYLNPVKGKGGGATAGGTLGYTAQWNDDIHHAFHVALTGEAEGYYGDYADHPTALLVRCLAQGFGYQGEYSAFQGSPRGTPSGYLPPSAFVTFLQNHDQIGNRAMGERIVHLAEPEAVWAAMAIVLLAPMPPLLFMGDEWGAEEPFLFFCDFHDGLADAVREGRRGEFASFSAFSDPSVRERIPDPNDPKTFARSVLDWSRRSEEGHKERLDLVRRLLTLRHGHITPRLEELQVPAIEASLSASTAFSVTWMLSDNGRLRLVANLGPEPADGPAPDQEGMACLYTTHPEHGPDTGLPSPLPPWFVRWSLGDPGHGGR